MLTKLILESTEFYIKFDQATSRKLSVLSRSILSKRNFLKIESLETPLLQHEMTGFCTFEDHLDQRKIKEGWISNWSRELFIRCKKSMRKLTC